MQLVHHYNFYDTDGNVYCEWIDDVVPAARKTSNHRQEQCAYCPYFGGTLQHDEGGIECIYEDSTVKEDYVSTDSPWEWRDRRRKARPIEEEKRHRGFIVKE